MRKRQIRTTWQRTELRASDRANRQIILKDIFGWTGIVRGV